MKNKFEKNYFGNCNNVLSSKYCYYQCATCKMILFKLYNKDMYWSSSLSSNIEILTIKCDHSTLKSLNKELLELLYNK